MKLVIGFFRSFFSSIVVMTVVALAFSLVMWILAGSIPPLSESDFLLILRIWVGIGICVFIVSFIVSLDDTGD